MTSLGTDGTLGIITVKLFVAVLVAGIVPVLVSGAHRNYRGAIVTAVQKTEAGSAMHRKSESGDPPAAHRSAPSQTNDIFEYLPQTAENKTTASSTAQNETDPSFFCPLVLQCAHFTAQQLL